MNSNELSITKPVSVWNKDLSAEPGKLVKGIVKAVMKAALRDWSGVGDAGMDIIDAVGLQKKPNELAWLLIFRSLIAALVMLLRKYDDLIKPMPSEEEIAEKITALFEGETAKAEVTIDLHFFEHPKEFPLLQQLRAPLVLWLQELKVSPAAAEQIASRLPEYFTNALHETWRAAPQDYAELEQYIDNTKTPFRKAAEDVQGWSRYRRWLQSKASERMFAEVFGVDKVYVPLRAYYEERTEKEDCDPDLREENRAAKKIVVDLDQDFRSWLEQCSEPAVRLISGGPGSGKSTFAKIFAAQIAEETSIPVLYIPLHLFDAVGNLVEAMGKYIDTNESSFLSGNPLHPKDGEKRLLIIFDGLDELASQGKAASETANAFVEEVLRRIQDGNSKDLQRQVLITGRIISIQSVASRLREKKQICHVLPYLVENLRRPSQAARARSATRLVETLR